MNYNPSIQELYSTVIKGNYCIGCGACALVPNSPFKIEMNKYGNLVAILNSDEERSSDHNFLETCPFSGKSINEEKINEVYFKNNKNNDKHLGRYLKCFAGHVTDENSRSISSSGGIGKWLGKTLLEQNEIDYFVQVVPNNDKYHNSTLFSYQIFKNSKLIGTGAKSSYYPNTLVNILSEIKEIPGKYAITGVPCFIKTIRLLSLTDKELNDRIKYAIGIVCGGMKSANQSKMIGWQLGVEPKNLFKIDFRGKQPNKPANYKVYQVWSNIDNIERRKDSTEIIGTDYGTGYFKPKACDYCDDVVGETADISIGDAWLPQYVKNPKGTSIIIVRNQSLLKLIEKYSSLGELKLDELTKDEVIQSQAGGFRHRREGLSYRLSLKEKLNEWYPQKRIKANEFKISKKRKRIYELREKIAEVSHIAFYNALQKIDLNLFIDEMAPLVKEYKKANQISLPSRIIRRIKKIFS